MLALAPSVLAQTPLTPVRPLGSPTEAVAVAPPGGAGAAERMTKSSPAAENPVTPPLEQSRDAEPTVLRGTTAPPRNANSGRSWSSDHMAAQLNRQELARLSGGGAPKYRSYRPARSWSFGY